MLQCALDTSIDTLMINVQDCSSDEFRVDGTIDVNGMFCNIG